VHHRASAEHHFLRRGPAYVHYAQTGGISILSFDSLHTLIRCLYGTAEMCRCLRKFHAPRTTQLSREPFRSLLSLAGRSEIIVTIVEIREHLACPSLAKGGDHSREGVVATRVQTWRLGSLPNLRRNQGGKKRGIVGPRNKK